MNCTNCKAEWTPPSGVSITQCPFCGKPLFEIQNSRKNTEPHEILLNIVQQYDRKKLGDTLLKGMLSDLMPHVEKKYQRIFKQALDDKIGSKLLDLEDEDNSIRIVKINTLKDSFKNNNGFDQTADYVVDCFLFALGRIETINKEQYSQNVVDSLSLINQQIDISFIDGILNKEEAKHIFLSAQKLGLADNNIVDLINVKIKNLKLKPYPATPKSLKNEKEIICFSDWNSDLMNTNLNNPTKNENLNISEAEWAQSQITWLDSSKKNTIQDGSNLLDNNPTTYGYITMDNYTAIYTKHLYLNLGTSRKIDGFMFSFEFPNCLQGKSSNYPGNIAYTCKVNLYYKDKNQWASAHNSPNLDTNKTNQGSKMSDIYTVSFPEIDANELKLEMIGNYYLGGEFQTTTYFRVNYIKFKMISNNEGKNNIINSNNNIQKLYTQVIIGNQIWMADNLNVENFRNGDEIPNIQSPEEWVKYGEEKKPAWCNYENNTENRILYGRLYNWWAVTDERGLAPIGWHISIETEWKELEKFCDKKPGNKLKSKEFWTDKKGTDDYGFSGLPSGYRDKRGKFEKLGSESFYWTSNELNKGDAKAFYIWSYMSGISKTYKNKAFGFSVRCLKD